MSTTYTTTGTWVVAAGRDDDFIDAWAAFASWATTQAGAGTLRLGRDVTDPRRFVSFGVWESLDDVHAWKATAEFQEGLARILQHVDEFRPLELEVLVVAHAGAAQRTAHPVA
jgi:heme-degrading monooxygenase HmoA